MDGGPGGAVASGAGPVGFDGATITEPPRFQGLPEGLPGGEDLLVALDIDGTLLSHDGALSPAVHEAVHEVVRSGAQVVLSTGRSITAVTPVLKQLGLHHGWAVCSNGAVTAKLAPRSAHGYELADVITFDPEPPLRLLHRHLPDGLFAVEDVGAGFKVNAPFPPGELLGQVRVVDFETLCAQPAARVTLRAPDLDADDFHELVDRTGLDGVSYAVGWTAWLDIHPEGVSKASALEKVRRHLGIRPGASVAAGDGRNDIEMLGWAGFGVAMGGADAETVAAADVTTAGVQDDGVVPVLRAIASRRGAS
ncbi:MAG TPA: HAD family hydrolase [Beutenbergiaceae bacterium]|nr:HAD family hydrolase [Beutenbergiaceae bacterium]